jgi:hypothetical protein
MIWAEIKGSSFGLVLREYRWIIVWEIRERMF